LFLKTSQAATIDVLYIMLIIAL